MRRTAGCATGFHTACAVVEHAGAGEVEPAGRPAMAAYVGAELLEMCGGLQVGSGFEVTRNRLWSGQGMVVWQDAQALSAEKAADVLDRIAERTRTCRSYVRKEGEPERVVTSDAAVEAPAGFDGFDAYCETAPDVREGQHNCQAHLGRGDLLVNFGSNVVSTDPAAAGSRRCGT